MHSLSFQSRVFYWLVECFGLKVARDLKFRRDRFLEEAIELAQSAGSARGDAHALVDYVFDRPAGDPKQEIGGVALTLAGLASAMAIDGKDAAETELQRVWGKIELIRAKDALKPLGSPLPGNLEAVP